MTPKTEPGLSEMRFAFKTVVIALDQGCICGMWRGPVTRDASSPCEGELHAHHVITQQQLRKAGLDEYLWDAANGAAVCERHHRRHHNRNEPISEMALPRRCLDFIAALDLSYLLDRYYEA